VILLIAAATASARPPYFVTNGPYRALAGFVVSYSGSGNWHTVYHSQPPNPGGNPDTNDANDSGTQRWSVTFQRRLVVPRCGVLKRHATDRCQSIKSLIGTRGNTSATGRVKHRHLDGLFPALTRSISCTERVRTGRRAILTNSLVVRYQPRLHALTVTAHDPVVDALNILPSQCPGQGDSIDGLYDNYFTPGFSFDTRYGADRWFTSRTIVIPAGVLHRAKRIRIALSNTRVGTPPRNCHVAQRSYERCVTGGSWHGTLTLSRR
jgi:hypothetical protein